MTTLELKALIISSDFSKNYYLIDVRTHDEWIFNRLPQAHHYPLDDLIHSYKKLPHDKHLIVYCHHGVRSYHACQLLNSLSFDMVENLEGGIHCWAMHIDPQVKQY